MDAEEQAEAERLAALMDAEKQAERAAEAARRRAEYQAERGAEALGRYGRLLSRGAPAGSLLNGEWLRVSAANPLHAGVCRFPPN